MPGSILFFDPKIARHFRLSFLEPSENFVLSGGIIVRRHGGSGFCSIYPQTGYWFWQMVCFLDSSGFEGFRAK